ncbi:MAG TPA: hypothetical protein VJB05_00570, partial [archaeon]|nr:hypothetical protein [archaeon]
LFSFVGYLYKNTIVTPKFHKKYRQTSIRKLDSSIRNTVTFMWRILFTKVINIYDRLCDFPWKLITHTKINTNYNSVNNNKQPIVPKEM